MIAYLKATAGLFVIGALMVSVLAVGHAIGMRASE